MLIAELAEDSNALLVQRIRPRKIASVVDDVGERKSGVGHAPPIRELLMERKRLFRPQFSRCSIAGVQRHHGRSDQRLRASRRRTLVPCQRAFETAATFLEAAPQVPEPRRCSRQSQHELALTGGLEPV